jgi:hypothetical protein
MRQPMLWAIIVRGFDEDVLRPRWERSRETSLEKDAMERVESARVGDRPWPSRS